MAFNWTLRAVLPSSPPVAVLERSWARWGALMYLRQAVAASAVVPQDLSEWHPCAVAPQNPCTFLRTGVGQLPSLRRPRYGLTATDESYFVKATTSRNDYLKQLFINETADHEPTFASAASVLPPTLDYTMLKNTEAHSGFSVSPQGRVMSANYSIRENLEHGNSPVAHGGLLLFDPRDHLPFAWPKTNFSEMKSAMIGADKNSIVLLRSR
jgi:hypothetical protein